MSIDKNKGYYNKLAQISQEAEADRLKHYQDLQNLRRQGILPLSSLTDTTIKEVEEVPAPLKYSERPYAPVEADNVTYLGATMLDHYTSISLEGLMSNPEHKDTPIPDLVRIAIQTANETCRQLEILHNLKNGS